MTQPTYSHTVGNKPIWVFDNLCSQDEATSIFKGLEISAFKHNEVARPDTAQYKHWAVGLSDAQIASLPVYQRAMAQISETTGKKYRAYRGYVNYASYGDMLFTHTESWFQTNYGFLSTSFLNILRLPILGIR